MLPGAHVCKLNVTEVVKDIARVDGKRQHREPNEDREKHVSGRAEWNYSEDDSAAAVAIAA